MQTTIEMSEGPVRRGRPAIGHKLSVASVIPLQGTGMHSGDWVLKSCAINTLRKIRRRHSERFLEPALGAMVTAWPSEKNAFTTAMIAAGERVLRTNAVISARQLAKALAIDVPPRLINAGRLYAVDHDIRISPAISRVIIGRVHQARTRKAA